MGTCTHRWGSNGYTAWMKLTDRTLTESKWHSDEKHSPATSLLWSSGVLYRCPSQAPDYLDPHLDSSFCPCTYYTTRLGSNDCQHPKACAHKTTSTEFSAALGQQYSSAPAGSPYILHNAIINIWGGGKKKEVNEELPQQLLPPRNMTYIGSPSRRAIVLHSEWSAKSHHWALQDAGDFAGSAVPYCLVLPPERAPISKKQNWRWALSSMMTELLLGPGPVGQHIKTQGFFHLFVILFVFKHAPLLPHFTNSWTLMNSKHFEARSLKHFAINGTKAHVKTHWDSNGMLCD